MKTKIGYNCNGMGRKNMMIDASAKLAVGNMKNKQIKQK
jgi:hypothetical protein